MGVREREISKSWVKEYLAGYVGCYAFRIHDCPWQAKPFDMFIFAPKVTWAIEFKVDRRKAYRYTIDELPMHQLRALREFSNGSSRQSKVVVYHEQTKTWHELEVK